MCRRQDPTSVVEQRCPDERLVGRKCREKAFVARYAVADESDRLPRAPDQREERRARDDFATGQRRVQRRPDVVQLIGQGFVQLRSSRGLLGPRSNLRKAVVQVVHVACGDRVAFARRAKLFQGVHVASIRASDSAARRHPVRRARATCRPATPARRKRRARRARHRSATATAPSSVKPLPKIPSRRKSTRSRSSSRSWLQSMSARSVCWRGKHVAAAAGEHPEALVEPVAQLPRTEHLDARGGEFDRQRNAVEPPADVRDGRRVLVG